MKTIINTSLLLILFSLTNLAVAQKPKFEEGDKDMNVKQEVFTKKMLKKIYFEATYNLYNKEFGEALPLFMKLLKNDPSNANFYYHVGICYYHMQDYQSSKSYLLIAAENSNEKYKDSVFERNAPANIDYYIDLIDSEMEIR